MLNHLTTEQHNPDSGDIDRLSPIEIVRLMNQQDAHVATAVGRQAEQIAAAIEEIVMRLRRGGRLVYIGAGTSGRLGVLDAAECPPTFSTDPRQVVGVIAGGPAALVRAIEGAEDQPDDGAHDLKNIGLSADDAVVGIATSGRTPYVIGGLRYARQLGAAAIGLSCNEDSQLSAAAQLMITPVVGPEVISGSTRMKAGTATKMVLNMLTTATMVQLGKTYGNRMVDLRATNSKLLIRSRQLVIELAEVDAEKAESLLQQCAGEVKTAIVVARCGVSPAEARQRLADVDGQLRGALETQRRTASDGSVAT